MRSSTTRPCRIDFRRIGQVKVGEQVCGGRTRGKVVKNKPAPPFQITEFDIRYGTGIDALGDLLDKAVEREVIKKSGSYYAFDGTSLGQGRERARESLLGDRDRRDRVRQKLLLTAPVPMRGR